MSNPSEKIALFWFRRDLRLHDNHGLSEALAGDHPVLPLFIFDTLILDELEDKKDARVAFIHDQLLQLKDALESRNSSLLVLHGAPEEVFEGVLKKYRLAAVYTNHDYEPYAIKRDAAIQEKLTKAGVAFHTFKDQVIFEKSEILTNAGDPYKVYTPYKNKWLDQLKEGDLKAFTNGSDSKNWFQTSPCEMVSLHKLGFEKGGFAIPEKEIDRELIKSYDKTRDKPWVETTRLGIHFRHGTLSIRETVKIARKLNETWLEELIWREFFMMILFHHPEVVDNAFKPKYNKIAWLNNEDDFKKWCDGRTGYPIVDAGMRQLNKTGFMHNRVRMVTASFLTKHLLIDWRWGEAYFAEKLLDYELASNNGNWQWVAGTGADAQPYFRIFNPQSQLEKFDKDQKYTKHWVPELGTEDYPKPMVDHKTARERAIKVFKAASDGK